MTISAGELEMVATLKDEVTGKLNDIDGGMEDFRTKLGVTGAAVTAFAAAAGRDFDNAKDIIVQGTGATGDALDELVGSFQALAGSVAGTSNESVASAVASINTLFGVTGSELETLATDVLQAKQAFGEFDIDTFGRSMNTFGLETADANGYLAHLGTVAGATGLNMGNLVSQSQTYGPVLKNLGLSATETATFFGKLHESGVDVSRVMPGLNAAMRRAADEGVTDLRSHLNDAIGEIRDAKTDTEALTIATKTFGAEGAQRMSSSIRSGILPSLDEMDGAIDSSTTSLEDQYEATVTLGDRLGMLKNQAMGLIGPFGDVAAGLGGVATTAVIAGPKIVGALRSVGAALITPPLGVAVAIATVIAGTVALIAHFNQTSDAAKKLETRVRELKDEFAANRVEFGKLTKAHRESKLKELEAEYKEINKVIRENRDVSAEQRQEWQDQRTEIGQQITALKSLAEKTDEVTAANVAWDANAKEVATRLKEINSKMEVAVRMASDWKSAIGAAAPAIATNYDDIATEADALVASILEGEEAARQAAAAQEAAGAAGEAGWERAKAKIEEATEQTDDAIEASAEYAEQMRRLQQLLGVFDSMGVPPIISDTISLLAQGDWFAAATNAASKFFGWLAGKDEERRRRQQEAHEERVRMWEEERQARIDAAKEVWEEEKQAEIDAHQRRMDNTEAFYDHALAVGQETLEELEGELDELSERFGEAVEEAFEWGKITNDLEAFLQELPDHIDADAIRSKIQSGLDQLQLLTNAQSDVQGLVGLTDQYATQRGLESFVAGGELTEEAIAEYVARGGDEGKLRTFADALAVVRAAEGTEEGPTAEQIERLETAANELQSDANDVLLDIHEEIKGVREDLDTEISSLKDIVTTPLTTAINAQKTLIEAVEKEKARVLGNMQTLLQALVDKEWNVNVHMTWPAQPTGPDPGPSSGAGSDPDNPLTNAMGGPVKAGDWSWVGEQGPELVRFGATGTVIPTHALNRPIIIYSTIEMDGEVAARGVSRHMPDVADWEGF